MDCFISVLYLSCVTPANLSSTLLLELPSFSWSSCWEGVRPRGCLLSGCVFNSSHVGTEQPHSPSEDKRGICSDWACPCELFPVPFFHKHINYQLAQKDHVLKRVWLLSHLPLLRAGIESTVLTREGTKVQGHKLCYLLILPFSFQVFGASLHTAVS